MFESENVGHAMRSRSTLAYLAYMIQSLLHTADPEHQDFRQDIRLTMPARTTKLRYRRIVADRATRALSRIFRLPSTSTVTFLLGLGASIWIIVGYAGLKIKENALRSANERRRNDRYVTTQTWFFGALIETGVLSVLKHISRRH